MSTKAKSRLGTLSHQSTVRPRRFLRAAAFRSSTVFASCAIAIACAFLAPAAVRADALNSNYQGFDSCSTPTTSQMLTWWDYSPYYTELVYLGGENACGSEGNSSWFSTVTGQGWQLVPIWVGLQAPCTSGFYTMSSNTTTAYSQGENDAASAASQANAMGFGSSYSTLVDDIEQYDAGNSACNAAVRSFAAGWDAGLSARGYTPAVYESASDVSNLATISSVPDIVWIAGGGYYASTYSSSATVWGNAYIGNGEWLYDQRFYQYNGSHSDGPYGGLSLTIDSDASNARVFHMYGSGADYDGSGVNQLEGSEANSSQGYDP